MAIKDLVNRMLKTRQDLLVNLGFSPDLELNITMCDDYWQILRGELTRNDIQDIEEGYLAGYMDNICTSYSAVPTGIVRDASMVVVLIEDENLTKTLVLLDPDKEVELPKK
jgi:hypothetical protein